jgi:hypothetical protein
VERGGAITDGQAKFEAEIQERVLVKAIPRRDRELRAGL